jgi:hypothetical protein
MGRLYVGVARAWAYAINPWRRRLSEERFLSARPGAQETCAGKSRVAAFGMTGGWAGFMSELKLRPPKETGAKAHLACVTIIAALESAAPLTEVRGFHPLD